MLAILALAAVAVAVAAARGRTFAGFLWSFVSLAEFESSWYLAWALPYAAIRPKLLTIYLLSLPLAAYELANQYTQTSMYIVIVTGSSSLYSLPLHDGSVPGYGFAPALYR